MIPKIIHFIYGLDNNYFNKPFCFFHYLAILSAKQCNDCPIFLHVNCEPIENVWWEKTKSLVELKKISIVPSEILGRPIFFQEHKCDILRLQILREYGGIYLDIDMICNKSFDALLMHECVMGLEIFQNHINGLCNAVLLSEPNSNFLSRLLDSYIDFDPMDWNQMPVRMPYKIAQQFPETIHIEPNDSFFKFDWHTIIDIFNGDACVFNGYSIHLWESKLYHPILKHICLEDIHQRDCLYNRIAIKQLKSSSIF